MFNKKLKEKIKILEGKVIALINGKKDVRTCKGCGCLVDKNKVQIVEVIDDTQSYIVSSGFSTIGNFPPAKEFYCKKCKPEYDKKVISRDKNDKKKVEYFKNDVQIEKK